MYCISISIGNAIHCCTFDSSKSTLVHLKAGNKNSAGHFLQLTSVNAIWSPAQIPFSPGLKCHSVLDPHVIQSWTQMCFSLGFKCNPGRKCDLVANPNAIRPGLRMRSQITDPNRIPSETQKRFCPRPSCNSILDTNFFMHWMGHTSGRCRLYDSS